MSKIIQNYFDRSFYQSKILIFNGRLGLPHGMVFKVKYKITFMNYYPGNISNPLRSYNFKHFTYKTYLIIPGYINSMA